MCVISIYMDGYVYIFIASQLQIHLRLLCFVVLLSDPANVSPLPGGAVLGFVSGGTTQKPGTSFPVSRVLSSLLASGMQDTHWCSHGSKFQPHPWGPFSSEFSSTTQGLPNEFHQCPGWGSSRWVSSLSLSLTHSVGSHYTHGVLFIKCIIGNYSHDSFQCSRCLKVCSVEASSSRPLCLFVLLLLVCKSFLAFWLSKMFFLFSCLGFIDLKYVIGVLLLF